MELETTTEDEYRAAMSMLYDALMVYADPEFYHAIMIIPDRPTGGFDEDVSLVEWSDYDRPMPGKLARDTIDEVCKKFGHLTLAPNCDDK